MFLDVAFCDDGAQKRSKRVADDNDGSGLCSVLQSLPLYSTAFV